MKKKLTADLQLKLMMLAGLLLRLVYIIGTPVVQNRQYDLGSVSPAEGIYTGHLGYIFYLFENQSLPNFDPREVYQFFHPPLHHILSSVWMGFVSLFTDNMNTWIECLQVLPFIYSALILLVIWKICQEMGIKEKALSCVMAIVIFHPMFIFMAGSINNDCLALLFQFLCVLTAIRWYKNRTSRNILWLALSISLGMLTKLSVALCAVPVAILFLYVFIKEWKENGFPLHRMLQYVFFGCVCVPIGLAWALRCFILYKMPLAYVNALPVESWQYVGDHSLWQRFGIVNPLELIKGLAHGSLGFGENVWMQLFRTAALGECDLTTFPLYGKVLALLMIGLAGILAVVAFVFLVKWAITMFGNKQTETDVDFGIKMYWILSYVLLLFSYLRFSYGFPHECTMNFRYMVPNVLFPAAALGLWLRNGKASKGKKVIEIWILLYSVVSIIMTGVWMIAV